ncbi:MAG: L-seryl-tRNA(Sec) selenium transferase [Anaerolineae bacterium]|nr:L-seryl-tRNA(Sec) selenium transferase [Anaerolineae bacterium]
MTNAEQLRLLPSVDRLLGDPALEDSTARYGHHLTVTATREVLEQVREEIKGGQPTPSHTALVTRVEAYLRQHLAPTLRPVVNATGVVIHTNLGRAPLSAAARAAMEAAARGYSNLEYDLDAGQRGQRTLHTERLLCKLTGAESALVVNNNAGAVMLALNGLAAGRGVLISRGQLVEIGGGFRVPDVMAQSGARLIEVGTTNRTHRQDYARELAREGSDVALILRAHHSNFRIVGFTTEVEMDELVALGQAHGVPVMDDIGSGALLDTGAFGLTHEPMVQESLKAGAALVCFSGDKLLGGPQAGIIVGQAAFVDPLKRHPLARALRADKLCLAALQATLMHYLKGEAATQVPVWRMVSMALDEIDRRARRWRDRLRRAGIAAQVIDGRSTVGGGSLPGETLPTRLLALPVPAPDALVAALRLGDPPIVARIEGDCVVFDPRTVLPEDEAALLDTLVDTLLRIDTNFHE